MVDLLAAGTVVLVLDQVSKGMIPPRVVPLGRFARLRPVTARRERYASRHAQVLYFFLLTSAAAAALVLTGDGGLLHSRDSAVALGAALGGAAGNLTDMVRHRGVIDFIDIGWWPVFNLADAAIVSGVAVAMLLWMAG